MKLAIAILAISLGIIKVLGFQFPMFAARGSALDNQLMLDKYPSAVVAYSIRLLTTNYVGNCFRVRRTSDNSEQDIGFSGEDLDESSLTTFCSGTDGYITTWYDQIGGGNNLVMSTNANQPKIVTAGAIIEYGGLPALTFVNDTRLGFATNVVGTAPWTMSFVWSRETTNHNIQIMTSNNTGVPAVRTDVGGGPVIYIGPEDFYSAYTFSGATAGVTKIYTITATGSAEKLYSNGSLLTPVPGFSHLSLPSAADFESLGGNTAGNHHNGTIQELIYWATDKSSTALAINARMNRYFATY